MAFLFVTATPFVAERARGFCEEREPESGPRVA